MDDDMIPVVSVIIPVYNEAGRIGPTVDAVLSSTRLPIEIIVVDDGSIDGCCDPLQKSPNWRVRLQRQPHTGAAAARNTGAAQAATDLLVFVDGHTDPEPGWLETMIKALDDQSIITSGIGTEEGEAYGYGTTITSLMFDYTWLYPDAQEKEPVYLVPGAGSGSMLVCKSWYDYIGGFDSMRGLGCEDIELCLRCWAAGGTIKVARDAKIRHHFKAHDEPGRETDWSSYLYNVMRASILHHNVADRKAVFKSMLTWPDAYQKASAWLKSSDIGDKSRRFKAIQRRDLQWLRQRFEMPIEAKTSSLGWRP